MNSLLTEYLAEIYSGQSQKRNNLQLIPLFHKRMSGSRDYLLLDEAMDQGTLQLAEASEQGMVNNLIVINLAKKPVLIFDGEELIGAKQNRMVNATMLIPAEGKLDIPVSCVERGRWHYNSRHFGKSDAQGYSELRRKKAATVANNLSRNMSFVADQGEVWSEIDRKQAAMGMSSETDAMHDVYRQYKKELDEFIAGLRPIDNQTGIAVLINGKFTCLDIFSHADVLAKLWEKLLKSYAMEALEQKELKTTRSRSGKIEPLLNELQEAELNQYPSVGLGTDIRLMSKKYMAAGLIAGERVLHLAAFPKWERKTESSRFAQPSRRRTMH
ncbi:MAG: hypothetical protein GYA42_00835 [Syntrophomonadaceae bacterium]|nr:hypothetical protein [Syntrophomonadaceae bacterium]